jgi:hypothetical protein
MSFEKKKSFKSYSSNQWLWHWKQTLFDRVNIFYARISKSKYYLWHVFPAILLNIKILDLYYKILTRYMKLSSLTQLSIHFWQEDDVKDLFLYQLKHMTMEFVSISDGGRESNG